MLGTPITRALDSPVFVTSWPGSKTILVVAERGSGLITFWNQTATGVVTHTVADLSSTAWIPSSQSEFIGLTGFAFHPKFLKDPKKRFLYVRFNLATSVETQVVQFNIPPGSLKVDPASSTVVYSAATNATGHGSGTLQFDTRDNLGARLYVPMPDNARANIATPMICCDAAKVQGVSGPKDFGDLLSVMVDVPGFPVSEHATGLRNPFGFSVDQGEAVSGLGKGDVWIGDTGWTNTGSIMRWVPTGGHRNYGWPWQVGDGTLAWALQPAVLQSVCGATGAGDPSCAQPPSAPSFDLPFTTFSDDEEFPFSISDALIGGYVYRTSAIPALTDKYVFGTYGQNSPRIYAMSTTSSGSTTPANLTGALGLSTWPSTAYLHALGQGGDGEIYLVRSDDTAVLGNGFIYEVTP